MQPDDRIRAAIEATDPASAQSWSRRRFLFQAGKVGGGIILLPSVAALVAACSPASTAAPSAGGSAVASSAPSQAAGPSASSAGVVPKAGGILNAAVSGNPDKLDPGSYSLYGSRQLFGNIFSNLIEMDSNGQFYGNLATAWTNPDPKTYVFDLVPNATFHNGEAFTSADVKYSFMRILDPKTASNSQPLFKVISSIDTPSPTRVVFNLSSPSGPFLINLATQGYIVNQKAIESSDPARNPVGTGPFQFVEWIQGDHVTVKKFPNYFKSGLPYLDQVVFKFLNLDESRMQALKSGQLDWSDGIPLQDIPSVQNDPTLTYVTAGNAGIPDYFGFNCSAPPFNNKLLRQAVAWAVDRKAIRDAAYFGTGEVGVEEVPSASVFYDGVDPYASAPDMTKAMALMAQSGVKGPINCEFIGEPQFPELLKTGEIIQQQIAPLGINMKITSLDESVWLTRFSKKQYDTITAYFAGTVDPDTFYGNIISTTAPYNWNGYSNPAADALIAQGASEPDLAKRKTIYAQLRAIVAEDAPVIWTHYETIHYLMKSTVVGSTINPDLALRLELVGYSS